MATSVIQWNINGVNSHIGNPIHINTRFFPTSYMFKRKPSQRKSKSQHKWI